VTRDGGSWIERLNLAPHPEGGFYRQTYCADLLIGNLPPSFAGNRPASTAIYFLLDGRDFSAFHRLRSDELWHFYAGERLSVQAISPGGDHSEIRLGCDVEAGETFQAVVKAGCWFGSRLADPESFALVGCTVAPGFDFADFELAQREELIALYPRHRQLIVELTRR
jgi:predicted cupin superfamily sugar epimerase